MNWVIDADAHALEPDDIWDKYLDGKYLDRKPKTMPLGQRQFGILYGDLLISIFTPPNQRGQDSADVETRLRDMDIEGIQASVLFPSMYLGINQPSDPDYVAALCAGYNNWISDFCRQAPDRLKGVALVSQRNTADAAAELRRAVTNLGLVGVMVRPNSLIVPRVDAPFYYPLYEEAERLGVPILVHEGVGGIWPLLGKERAKTFADSHMMTHPYEMMTAVMCVTTSEVLDRFPRLQFGFFESGCGWIPYWLERLDEHCEKLPEEWPTLREPPSERFKRNCSVSFEPEEVLLPQAISCIGADRVLFASDYPHWDAILPGCVEAVMRRKDIDEADKTTILTEAPGRLFKIPIPKSPTS
jgi:predicted TIM-barrel fold metal-dependent hydrolase